MSLSALLTWLLFLLGTTPPCDADETDGVCPVEEEAPPPKPVTFGVTSDISNGI